MLDVRPLLPNIVSVAFPDHAHVRRLKIPALTPRGRRRGGSTSARPTVSAHGARNAIAIVFAAPDIANRRTRGLATDDRPPL